MPWHLLETIMYTEALPKILSLLDFQSGTALTPTYVSSLSKDNSLSWGCQHSHLSMYYFSAFLINPNLLFISTYISPLHFYTQEDKSLDEVQLWLQSTHWISFIRNVLDQKCFRFQKSFKVWNIFIYKIRYLGDRTQAQTWNSLVLHIYFIHIDWR